VPAHVVSVNLGAREPNPAKTVGVTGIRKRPVDAATLRDPGPKHGGLGSGLVDDFIGDVRHHGGDLQAVYAFAREELDFWEGRLGVELAHGSFGENLTTRGLDVDAALIGDRWAVGDEVVLEVTGPRIPCATFAARMGIRGWVKTFAAEARSGAYLAVVTGGVVRPGDEVRVVARAEHDVDVPTTFRAFMGDLEAAAHVLAVGCLPEHELAALRDMVERRRPKGA
jgi:MOSC domain-containing protein YiiM